MNTPTHAPPPAVPAPRTVEDARERAIAVLTDRYAEGAIDDAALEVLLDRLHAAHDLPAVDALVEAIERARPVAVVPVSIPSAYPATTTYEGIPALAPRRILAIMGETRRTGRWVVPAEMRVIAVMSDLKLDFRNAVLPPLATIDVTCVMGVVQVIVPPGLPVIFEPSAMMATATSNAIEPEASTTGPVLHVIGSALMAEIKVVVKEVKAR